MSGSSRVTQALFGVIMSLALLMLPGCAERQPIQIGFIAGLSGPNADLGTGGRNGAQLAVEEINARGGIGGRRVDLIIKDDALNPDTARQAFRELQEQGVQAIVGPMTSIIAVTITPLADEAGILLMGGSVTTEQLSDLDDMFFRVIGSAGFHAGYSAEYLHRQASVVRLIKDENNAAYSNSWAESFRNSFEELGGRLQDDLSYRSSPSTDFRELALELLEAEPEVIICVTSAVDAALLITQIRQLSEEVIIATSEWAGTGKLIELGGRAVEGVIVPQYINYDDQGTAYRDFLLRYRDRFAQEAGFPMIVGYNAASIVLTALSEQKRGETLKQTISGKDRFAGLQEDIIFNSYGDTPSSTYITVIRNGEYIHGE